MESIKVQGKRIDATKLKGLLFSLANSIKRNADIIGSIDGNKYGAQCSFVINGTVIGLSWSNLIGKGGAL